MSGSSHARAALLNPINNKQKTSSTASKVAASTDLHSSIPTVVDAYRLPASLALVIDELLAELGSATAIDSLEYDQYPFNKLTSQLNLRACLHDNSSEPHPLESVYAQHIQQITPRVTKRYDQLIAQYGQDGYTSKGADHRELLAQIAWLIEGCHQYVHYWAIANNQSSSKAWQNLQKQGQSLADDAPQVLPNIISGIKDSRSGLAINEADAVAYNVVDLLAQARVVKDIQTKLGLTWLDWLVLPPQELAQPNVRTSWLALKYHEPGVLSRSYSDCQRMNEQIISGFMYIALSLYLTGYDDWLKGRFGNIDQQLVEAMQSPSEASIGQKNKIIQLCDDYIGQLKEADIHHLLRLNVFRDWEYYLGFRNVLSPADEQSKQFNPVIPPSAPFNCYLDELAYLIQWLVHYTGELSSHIASFYKAFKGIAQFNNTLWQVLGQRQTSHGFKQSDRYHYQPSQLDQLSRHLISLARALDASIRHISDHSNSDLALLQAMFQQSQFMQHQVQMYKAMIEKGEPYDRKSIKHDIQQTQKNFNKTTLQDFGLKLVKKPSQYLQVPDRDALLLELEGAIRQKEKQSIANLGDFAESEQVWHLEQISQSSDHKGDGNPQDPQAFDDNSPCYSPQTKAQDQPYLSSGCAKKQQYHVTTPLNIQQFKHFTGDKIDHWIESYSSERAKEKSQDNNAQKTYYLNEVLYKKDVAPDDARPAYATFFEDLRMKSHPIMPYALRGMLNMLKYELGCRSWMDSLSLSNHASNRVGQQLVLGPYNCSGLRPWYVRQLKRSILPEVVNHHEHLSRQCDNRQSLTYPEKRFLVHLSWIISCRDKLLSIMTKHHEMTALGATQYLQQQGQAYACQNQTNLGECQTNLKQMLRQLNFENPDCYIPVLEQAYYVACFCAHRGLSMLDFLVLDGDQIQDQAKLASFKRLKYGDSQVHRQVDQHLKQLVTNPMNNGQSLLQQQTKDDSVTINLPVYHYINHLACCVDYLFECQQDILENTGRFFNAFQSVATMSNQIWQFLGSNKGYNYTIDVNQDAYDTQLVNSMYESLIGLVHALRSLRDKMDVEYRPGNEVGYSMLKQAKMMQHQTQTLKIMPTQECFDYKQYYAECIYPFFNSRERSQFKLNSPRGAAQKVEVPDWHQLLSEQQRKQTRYEQFFIALHRPFLPSTKDYSPGHNSAKSITRQASLQHTDDTHCRANDQFFNSLLEQVTPAHIDAYVRSDYVSPPSNSPSPVSFDKGKFNF